MAGLTYPPYIPEPWQDRFGRVRYTWDTALIYVAFHPDHKAADTDSGWQIFKLTYDVTNNITGIQGPLNGTVDGQAGLDWGS